MLKRFLHSIFVLLMVPGLVFAAITNSITGVSKVSCVGVPDTSGNCPVETDDSRYVSFPGGSILEKIEVKTTSDTLTVAECGKTILANISSGDMTLTLPESTGYGCYFKVVAINGHATSGQGRIIIDPQSSDTLVGCVSSSVTTTFAAGDSLRSPEATGDTIKVTDYTDGSWACSDRIGTWADNN